MNNKTKDVRMLVEIDVIEKIKYPSGQTQNLCLYRCECGNEIKRLATSVKDIDKAHCGCLFDYATNWKYGKQLKKRWNGLNSRTINGNHPDKLKLIGPYTNVTICDEWKKSFKSFYSWSIDNGFKPHLHIDRIDATKGYQPDNCRWVTQSENNRNGARSKLDTVRVREILLLHGVYSNKEIARIYAIDPSTLVNICKGVIWNDVFKQYGTDKNKVRLNPIYLLPINKTIIPGSIDFTNKSLIKDILNGNLAFGSDKEMRLIDLKNEFILYSQFDKSKNKLQNFFKLILSYIHKDEIDFERIIRSQFVHNKDIILDVTTLIKKVITKEIKEKFIMRFFNTCKIVLTK